MVHGSRRNKDDMFQTAGFFFLYKESLQSKKIYVMNDARFVGYHICFSQLTTFPQPVHVFYTRSSFRMNHDIIGMHKLYNLHFLVA